MDILEVFMTIDRSSKSAYDRDNCFSLYNELNG